MICEAEGRSQKGAPFLQLIHVGLEGDLGGELHSTSVIGEDLLRVVEGRESNGLEVVVRSEARVVDVINGSGDVLCVVEDVERLRAELERIVLMHRDPLEGRKIK